MKKKTIIKIINIFAGLLWQLALDARRKERDKEVANMAYSLIYSLIFIVFFKSAAMQQLTRHDDDVYVCQK